MAQVELSVPLASLGASLNSVIAVAAPGDYILTRPWGQHRLSPPFLR